MKPTEALAQAISNLAHGRCCWDAAKLAAAIIEKLPEGWMLGWTGGSQFANLKHSERYGAQQERERLRAALEFTHGNHATRHLGTCFMCEVAANILADPTE